MPSVKIGTILKNIRLESDKKFTQRVEGKIIGVSDTTISAYERNIIQPDFSTIKKLLEINNYSIQIVNPNGEKINLIKYSIDHDK